MPGRLRAALLVRAETERGDRVDARRLRRGKPRPSEHRSEAEPDRTEKLPIYAAQGVGHAWLVDPVLRTLEVLRLERGRWVLLDTYHDDARVRAEPFEVFELELDVRWAGVQLPAPPR